MATNEKFEAAIKTILPDEFITRWLVVLESTDSNGFQGIWVQCEASMKSWDVLGMLEFAKTLQLAKEFNEQR